MSMADLMAQQDSKSLSVSRGQEVEGIVIAVLPSEVVVDLGTKSEGILAKKDLPFEQQDSIQIGDKVKAVVIYTENDSGQVVLGLQRATQKQSPNAIKIQKFENNLRSGQSVKGRGVEVNKGGLVVEVGGVRGFLPSSQVNLSQMSNLDELVGQDLDLNVIEVDSNQNRLIFSQKTIISDETKALLKSVKSGDKVHGKVAAVLQFGVFVTLENGLEGLVHVSELSWDKVEDPNTLYKTDDEIEAQVLSIDETAGRLNLSIKQLANDPFADKAKDIEADDVLKATVTKVTPQGVFLTLKDDLEGFIPTSKLEAETSYEVGQAVTCLVDSIDTQKRRINLVPFITSTKDLIYK